MVEVSIVAIEGGWCFAFDNRIFAPAVVE